MERPSSSADEDELELGLALTLGGCGAGAGKAKGTTITSRILTAKDFPTGSLSLSGSKRAASLHDSVFPVSSSPPSSSCQVVGWPPVKTYRINNLLTVQPKPTNAADQEGNHIFSNDSAKKNINGGASDGVGSDMIKSTNPHPTAAGKENGHLGFVKVSLDGVQIGRKVDLNAHSSYEGLAQTIKDMFFRPNSSSIYGEKEKQANASKLLDGSSDFVLTYEDKEGDWMLVGDVPWRMFPSTVKKLRIMRTSEANGLAPRCQERNERQRTKPI